MRFVGGIKWKVYHLLVVYSIMNCCCVEAARNLTDMEYLSNETNNLNQHSMRGGRYSPAENRIQSQVFVPDTDDYTCQTDRDCSNGVSISSKMVCQSDHTCGCLDSCLTYTYTVYGIHAVFEFHCGDCGQLGSECENDDECEYPGLCSRKDHYCHCPYGEHTENICIVFDTHFIGSMLVFAFGIFGITILCGCGYQCFLGYRLYGNWRWWRNFPNWRWRRQAPTPVGPSKSPAFTATMNMWNTSESNSEGLSGESHLQHLPSTSSGIRYSLRRSTVSTSNTNQSISESNSPADLSSPSSSHSGQAEAAIIESSFSYAHSPSISSLRNIPEDSSTYL